MSHIIEEYSKSLGVKPGKPELSEHFFPVVYDEYITIDLDIVNQSDVYQYTEIFINQIKEFAPNIKIVDITSSRKIPAPYADISMMDECSYKQNAYIISKSKVHICSNILSSHIASYYNIPTVCIFSSLMPEHNRPVFSDNVTCISPNTEHKPCYSNIDPLNLITEIYPERISSAALDYLNIKHDLDKFKTLHIGKYFKNKILEIIPDFIPESDYSPHRLVNLRADHCYVEENIEYWLQFNCNLMINKAIDINIIKKYLHNIAGMTVFCGDESIDTIYVEDLQRLNIKFNLICKDKSKLSDIRLQFFNWTVEEYLIKDKKDLDFIDELCDNAKYDTNKELYSSNRMFASKAHWRLANEQENHNSIIDSPDFWEEIEHMHIYTYDN